MSDLQLRAVDYTSRHCAVWVLQFWVVTPVCVFGRLFGFGVVGVVARVVIVKRRCLRLLCRERLAVELERLVALAGLGTLVDTSYRLPDL